ncbi:MAG: M20 family peptidase, partial [Acidobacteria bacterium]|nr:M20 family peptidase [Acidobacteriota bacterium]
MIRYYRAFSIVIMALLLTLLLTPAASTQAPASDEQRIISYIDAHSEEAIRLLERSVNIESATLNQEGVRSVGRLFGAELETVGFKTRWIEMPKEMNRAGHLFAERQGTRGKRLLLIG